MFPVVTADEMRQIDAAAVDDLDTLIERAGWATAAAARRLLGVTYGKRVLVIAGPGNNGADGRVAARVLQRSGAKVEVVDAGAWRHAAIDWRRLDLLVDAAFGTGLRRPFDAPDLDAPDVDAPDLDTRFPRRPLVLAVDIPSGVHGDTGVVLGSALQADSTVTFGALKPGLLLGDGVGLCGPVTVANLGLDTSGARTHLLEASDLAAWPRRRRDAHKWRSAVWVIGGQPSMPGAPRLAVTAAARAGAGYVLASVPGLDAAAIDLPVESVGRSLDDQWADQVLLQADRVASFVVGPGLSTDDRVGAEVRSLVAGARQPVVVDAGAIDAVAAGSASAARTASRTSCLRSRSVAAVLTPHDGEFERLMGERPGSDRIAAARRAAEAYRSVVLLKGPTTVVASPDGRVLLSTAGDARLATAGTGDVLSGIVGAGLALGLDPFMAAGLGAELHGRAATRGHAMGLVAGDLPELVARVLSSMATGRPDTWNAEEGAS